MKIWYIILKNRFKKRNFIVLLKLQIEKYTITNTRNDKTFRVYMQNILRYARSINFFDFFNQMLITWINFDIDFRVHISKFKFDIQLETFLNQFDEKTNIWRNLKIVKRSNMFVNNVDKNNRFINKQNQTQKRQNEFSQSFKTRFVFQFLYFFANWYYNSNSIY